MAAQLNDIEFAGIFPVDGYCSGCRLDKPVYHLQGSSLAAPGWTQEHTDFTRPNIQVMLLTTAAWGPSNRLVTLDSLIMTDPEDCDEACVSPMRYQARRQAGMPFLRRSMVTVSPWV